MKNLVKIFVLTFIQLITLLGSLHMAVAANFTTEKNLQQEYNTNIDDFWNTGKFDHFNGVKNIRVNYASFVSANHKKCLVVVPGRSESYLKYKELSYDLYRQGFNLFIIDHRGQGLSERMLDNRYKGYVEKFDDYVEDLHTLMTNTVIPHCQTLPEHKAPYLLAHSLGGAISALYLTKYPNDIQAAVLSSPMIAINAGDTPTWLAEGVVKALHHMVSLFTKNSWYFFGQTDKNLSPFDDNSQSHSILRYQLFTELYQQQEILQLGGVTFAWLAQAIKAKQKIFESLNKISTPTLVLQAGKDTIVDNMAQTEFCQRLHKLNKQSCPNGKPTVIEGARHELFFEQDKYRIPALTQSLLWFEKHSNNK
jgi:lysophospholipase